MKVYIVPYETMKQWSSEETRMFWLNISAWCREHIGVQGVDWKLQTAKRSDQTMLALVDQPYYSVEPGIVVMDDKDFDEILIEGVMLVKLGVQFF